MCKQIRRKDRQLSAEETIEIINKCEYGVLATTDADNRPYAVPLNYVFHNRKIYFHCATSGHKIDNMDSNPNVSFCIVNNTEIIPDKFSTRYKSVTLFGKAGEVLEKEKEEGLCAILQRFSSEHMEAGKKYIKSAWDKTKVFAIEIEHMSGKGKE